MDLKEIKELIALFRKNDLSEFSLEQEDFKISLKRGSDSVPVVSAQSFAPVITHQTLPAGAHAAPAAAASNTPKKPSAFDSMSKEDVVRQLAMLMQKTRKLQEGIHF